MSGSEHYLRVMASRNHDATSGSQSRYREGDPNKLQLAEGDWTARTSGVQRSMNNSLVKIDFDSFMDKCSSSKVRKPFRVPSVVIADKNSPSLRIPYHFTHISTKPLQRMFKLVRSKLVDSRHL